MSLVAMGKRGAWAAVAGVVSFGLGAFRRRRVSLNASALRAGQLSFSQLGEDVVLRYLLPGPLERGGVYVDVGAFDPYQYSNTLWLYLHGWRGVNIDANPDRVQRFAEARPRDRNVTAAVSDRHRNMVYLRYPSEATNRLAPADAADRRSVSGEAPLSVTPVATRTLTEILDDALPAGTQIDFLNIDCEGEDFAVLRGLDWERWRPATIAVEAQDAATRDAIGRFLADRGFVLKAVTVVTAIFATGLQPPAGAVVTTSPAVREVAGLESVDVEQVVEV